MGYISALTYYSLLLLDAAAAELVDKAGGPVLYEAGRPVVSVVGTAEDKWKTLKNKWLQ